MSDNLQQELVKCNDSMKRFFNLISLLEILQSTYDSNSTAFWFAALVILTFVCAMVNVLTFYHIVNIE